MMDAATLRAIEKGAIAVTTTEAYADRLPVPASLSMEGTPAERLAGLREAVLREAATFVDTVPSVRLKPVELASYRAKLGGDPAEEGALLGLLRYKEELEPFIDFLFLIRAEVYSVLGGRAALAQADVDEVVLEVLTPWAGKYGYSGIRKIVDRDPGDVFTDSIRRGELQYDYFFKGQLFEIVAAPGHNIHGHFPHVLQWLYFSWRLDGESPLPEGVNQAMARIYRKVPEVTECELFRRLSDTFNSSVQLALRPGQAPNFPAMAANYRGFPANVTDPATVTRLFEMIFYTSLDAARKVALEPMQIMIVRPGAEEMEALYLPETDEEKQRWASRTSGVAGWRS
jgi:hypothetical protein